MVGVPPVPPPVLPGTVVPVVLPPELPLVPPELPLVPPVDPLAPPPLAEPESASGVPVWVIVVVAEMVGVGVNSGPSIWVMD